MKKHTLTTRRSERRVFAPYQIDSAQEGGEAEERQQEELPDQARGDTDANQMLAWLDVRSSWTNIINICAGV